MNDVSNRIGVCSWSLKPASPEDLARHVKVLGIGRVQLALSPMVTDPDTWGSAFDVLREAGIQVVSGMFSPIGEDYSTLDTIRVTGGIVPDKHWDANLAMATKIAAIAKREHIKAVTFHAGFVPHDHTDPSYARLRDRLVTLAKVFADAGCDLLLETGQETADDLTKFLDAVDQTNVGVNFDPANMILYGKGDPIEAVSKLIARVKNVHIKDATASAKPGEWGAEVPAGTGAVDWKRFFRVLNDASYTGYLVIEREAGDDRPGDIAKARQMVLKHLAGA
ncbi:MAG: sugar phosphate isomerase/epimerase family protein [Phycisphaerales bacterium]